MLTRDDFSGPWAGLPVAWTDNDEFDEPTYRGDVERSCKAGAPGVYTGGTTGEFYALEWEEFQRITRATVEECKRHGTPVMIGCSATSTRGAARRAAFAASVGADAIQLVLPFWMEVADDQVLPFFSAVTDASPGLALSIYETRRAKKTLTLEQHRQIHARLPQYRMLKAVGDTLGDTVEGCRALSEVVAVFVGESRWAELGPHGATGGCSSMIYWNPRVLLQTWKHLREQNWPALEADCRKNDALVEGLFAAFRHRGFTDTAYDRLGGLASGFLRTSLRNRAPYASPTADDVITMRALFQKHYPELLS